MNARRALVVTRPQQQAAQWLQRLQAAGVQALALPLLAIEPVAQTPLLAESWQALSQQRMAMFVSPNAVAAFFAARPAGAAWPAQVWAAGTGPGTAAALRAHGVPLELVVCPEQPPFESEALWALLQAQSWAGQRVLIACGDGGRGWFADTLRQAGAVVNRLQVYSRRAPSWAEPERQVLACVLAQPGGHCWWFSSSQAVAHLSALAPGTQWGSHVALASHGRIAGQARRCGFGLVLEVPPLLPDVVAALAALPRG